jgi:hypothetical protein
VDMVGAWGPGSGRGGRDGPPGAARGGLADRTAEFTGPPKKARRTPVFLATEDTESTEAKLLAGQSR